MNNFTKSIALLLIINKYSNAEKPITTLEINEHFKSKYNTTIDSRTIDKIVDSFNELQEEYEIERIKSKPNKYYFKVTPGLSFGESKAIIDLVYSSHFFTQYVKNNFTTQMKSLFNENDANQLNKVINTHITRNEDSKTFFDSYEKICKALHKNEIIFFDYIKPSLLNENKKNTRRKVVPIETICDNNNFYLYCLKIDTNEIRNYRIDHIQNVSLTNTYKKIDDCTLSLVREEIINSTFAHSADYYAEVTLSFDKSLYSNMIDKFGNQISTNTKIINNHTYKVTIPNCPISKTFYGWLIGFNGQIKIIEPKNEVNKFKEYLINEYIEE